MSKPRQMVRTRAHNDCGVCAIANRCNITWEAARKRLFGDTRKRNHSTTTRMVKQAMFVDGWRLIRAAHWRDVPNNSVVKVIPLGCRRNGNWHWVVWRDGMIWDSCREKPCPPMGYSCSLVSYIGYRE